MCGLIQNDELQSQIEKFCSIEEISNAKLLSKEESDCERISQEEYQRITDGFQVSLPFREDPSVLGETKSGALKRLCSMERRFQKDIILQTEYTKFMKEYVELDHMSVLDNPDQIVYRSITSHIMQSSRKH